MYNSRWFNSYHTTPVPSAAVDLQTFQEAGSEWQKYFSSSGDGELDDQIGRLEVLTGADREFVNCCFGQDFRHIQRLRDNSDILIEQFSPPVDITTSSSIEPENIISDSNADPQNLIETLENFDETNREALKIIAKQVDNEQKRKAASMDPTVPGPPSEALKEYCARLDSYKCIFKDPQLKSLEKNNIFYSKGQKCLDVSIPVPEFAKSINPIGDDLLSAVCKNDVILTVAVYNSQRPLMKLQEFQVLAESYLSQFKDAIHCLVDSWTPRHSEPERKHAGLFFIENTFFVDNRSNVDFSETLYKWRERMPHMSEKPSRQHMQTTKWSQIRPRVNMPYLYLHQGDCWHNFVVTDISAYNPAFHSARRRDYPIRIFQKPPSRSTCRFCLAMPATHMVFEDPNADTAALIFCHGCLLEYYGSETEARSRVAIYDIPDDLPTMG